VLLAHLKAELEKPEDSRDITLRYGKIVELTKPPIPTRRISTPPSPPTSARVCWCS
jgi:hypothetical protein